MQVYSTKSSIMLSQLCLNFESGGSMRWCFQRFRAMTASTSSVSSADGSDAETTLPRRRVGREDIEPSRICDTDPPNKFHRVSVA